jgi:hypothetical protein
MASDANGGTTNFHVVPPPQRPGYMNPYDLYEMDEADEEETKEMKKDALAWLQEQGYCDRTAQINSILLPKPLLLAIKQYRSNLSSLPGQTR